MVTRSPRPAPALLRFDEFFGRPVGPRGLEPSGRLLALDGKRVRIDGYMVEEESPTPGRFLLAAVPVALSDVEDGPADDLPPAVVFVHLVGAHRGGLPVHQRAPLALTGTLDVGNRAEPDGRVSMIRLRLDAPYAARAPASSTRRDEGAGAGANARRAPSFAP